MAVLDISPARERGIATIDPVDWSSYADVCDCLFAYHPAYQRLLTTFRKVIDRWALPPGSVIADFGAGTGTYSVALADAFPNCTVMHVDNDLYMTWLAKRKAVRNFARNWTAVERSIDDVDIEPGSLAAVVSVHALYAFPNPHQSLRRFADWLAPGGVAFIVDLGRELNVMDWLGLMFLDICRRYGLRVALNFVQQIRAIAKHCRTIARQQKAGVYWTHSHESFLLAVEAAGLTVEKSERCNRGYSDLVIARKPAKGAA